MSDCADCSREADFFQRATLAGICFLLSLPLPETHIQRAFCGRNGYYLLSSQNIWPRGLSGYFSKSLITTQQRLLLPITPVLVAILSSRTYLLKLGHFVQGSQEQSQTKQAQREPGVRGLQKRGRRLVERGTEGGVHTDSTCTACGHSNVTEAGSYSLLVFLPEVTGHDGQQHSSTGTG